MNAKVSQVPHRFGGRGAVLVLAATHASACRFARKQGWMDFQWWYVHSLPRLLQFEGSVSTLHVVGPQSVGWKYNVIQQARSRGFTVIQW